MIQFDWLLSKRRNFDWSKFSRRLFTSISLCIYLFRSVQLRIENSHECVSLSLLRFVTRHHIIFFWWRLSQLSFVISRWTVVFSSACSQELSDVFVNIIRLRSQRKSHEKYHRMQSSTTWFDILYDRSQHFMLMTWFFQSLRLDGLTHRVVNRHHTWVLWFFQSSHWARKVWRIAELRYNTETMWRKNFEGDWGVRHVRHWDRKEKVWRRSTSLTILIPSCSSWQLQTWARWAACTLVRTWNFSLSFASKESDVMRLFKHNSKSFSFSGRRVSIDADWLLVLTCELHLLILRLITLAAWIELMSNVECAF